MLNKVILQGRLTADPELKQTPQGVSVCSFTVACDRNYAAQGQDRQADFISVVAWRQTAEFVSKYFAKGRMILVEGTLRTRNYPDSRYSDVKHYVTEVYAENINFAGDKPAQNNNSGYGDYAPPPPPEPFRQPHQAAAPARAQAESAQPAAMSSGSFDDFEEVMGDEDKLPF